MANELILHAVYLPHLVPGATLPPVVAVESRNAITTIRLDVAAAPAPPECRELREAFIDGRELYQARADLEKHLSEIATTKVKAALLDHLADFLIFRTPDVTEILYQEVIAKL